ncbi:MAG: hypothetical protein KC516_04595 [Nanoarchaeota archaeon]|nr:hypothetical protein [Nanoarchaeota archaeon]
MVKKVTKTKYSYLEPFLTTREELHLLEISRRLKENHATIRKYLNEFENQGILKKSQKGRLTLYSLNLDSELLFEILVLAEKDRLLRLMETNFVLQELVFELHKITSKTLLIFGSASEGFKNFNDIDILTLDKNLDLKKLKNKFSFDFHVNYVPSLKSMSGTMRNEILKKHLIVNNSEEVVKWLI